MSSVVALQDAREFIFSLVDEGEIDSHDDDDCPGDDTCGCVRGKALRALLPVGWRPRAETKSGDVAASLRMDEALSDHDAMARVCSQISYEEFTALWKEHVTAATDYLDGRAWPWFREFPLGFIQRFSGGPKLVDALRKLVAARAFGSTVSGIARSV